jgi:hypothetical protein
MKLRVLKKRLRRAARERARRIVPDPGRHDWAMAPIRFKREFREHIARLTGAYAVQIPSNVDVRVVDVRTV